MIHDYRRLLLRDPELPAELLPPLWPGEQARTLCRSLYGHLLPASEAYLDQQLQLADGVVPAATAMLGQRFAP
jgi:phenylacetic acid degradation operon negative regulatory protein